MSLVLGFKGLPSAEMGLVRTIIRLSSMLAGQWTVTDGEDCDVLLTQWPVSEMGLDSEVSVVPLLPPGQATTGRSLRRPIRAEELIELLNAEAARHAALSTGEAGVSATSPSVAQPPDPHRAEARLRRWPSWSLLKADRTYVPMATMLSKSALSAQRLSELSGVRFDACVAFMRHMDAQQLLIWLPAAESRAEIKGEPAMEQNVAPQAAPTGLLHSLRRKLGILRA